MTAVSWLDRIEPDQAVRTGGPKVGRLVQLRSAGIRVPPGFVVSGQAYQQVMATAGLAGLWEETLSRLATGSLAPGAAAALLQGGFSSHCQLPASLRSELDRHYRELGRRSGAPDVPVAVRSSATVEDSATASFAGIFDSFLGVRGVDRVANAVRRCWASLFSERALGYASQMGVDLRRATMSVGVLRLIDARCAGVAFSMHPVTGDREVIVIEGAWGWGESVVQGSVTPDQLEVSKQDGRVLRWDVHDKARISRPDPETGEVTEVATPDQLRRVPCLTGEQAREVARQVAAVEAWFGCPVDVEWVVASGPDGGDDRGDEAERGDRGDAGPVYVTQARPISVAGQAAGGGR